MNTDENKIKAIETALGSPVSIGLDEKSDKIRKSLLLVSLCSIFLSLGGLHIDASSSFLGLKFSGLTDSLARTGLLTVNVYLFIHYFWCLFDSFGEWRLRITGTRLAYVTAGRIASSDADYPNDPRQSTLHHWWKDKAQSIGDYVGKFNELYSNLEGFESEIRKYSKDPVRQKISEAVNYISHAKKEVSDLKVSLKEIDDTIKSRRVDVSIQRFDNWFQLFLRSQSLRWCVFDVVIPIFAAVMAIVFLLPQ